MKLDGKKNVNQLHNKNINLNARRLMLISVVRLGLYQDMIGRSM